VFPVNYDDLEQALRDSRSNANILHGPGAWDVADVMAVVRPFVEAALQAHVRQENTASGQPKWKESRDCVYCAGSGIFGGPDSYYDAPGKGKPCNVCNGTGTTT
jgi:hypothetical protein